MPEIAIKIILFIYGALVGSFLNVCIYRMPRDELSVRKPQRSFCPHCNKQILWYDNIPFLSYIFLGGKCRFCKGAISFRYFLVELITASLLVVLYSFFGVSLQFFVYSVLTCALIVATFVDFEFQIIPDEITLGGLVIGVILCLLFPRLHNTGSRISSLIQAGLGILAGGGSIYLIGKFGEIMFGKKIIDKQDFVGHIDRIDEVWNDLIKQGYMTEQGIVKKEFLSLRTAKQMNIAPNLSKEKQKIYNFLIQVPKQAMGGGDVKFLAMIGAIVGWQQVLLIFFMAPFFGAIVGIILKICKGDELIPYGPYLSLATFLILLWGRNILDYYFIYNF